MRVVELRDSCTPSFARHETFHPRFGWLRKAYEHTVDPAESIFTRPDATVILGVGKNMVNAIRYWAVAFGIVEPYRQPGERIDRYLTTPLARTIFQDGGWDPYLEDPATLWLLHWNLLHATCSAPSWWVGFNLLTATQFNDEAVVACIQEASNLVEDWEGVVPGSIKKDADCFIRMYAQRRTGRQGLDDLFDCPFRELGLMEPVAGEHRTYRFNTAAKANLPDEVIAYASLTYLARVSPGANSISVARLALDPGSPGRSFKLAEHVLHEALGRLATRHKQIWVAEPAGLRQLYVDGEPEAVGRDLLAAYYQRVAASTSTLDQTIADRVTQLRSIRRRLEAQTDSLDRLRASRDLAPIEAELALLGVPSA